jgi:uncharacterized protein YcnI
VSPTVSLKGALQLYSLAVPTEKSGVATTKVVLSVPAGFEIDSFAPPPPGWRIGVSHVRGAATAVVTRVAWSGGRTPTGEDALFQFLAQPSAPGTYTFRVQQTYSDGSIVDWSGPQSSDAPAPTIEVRSSIGGSGLSVLNLLALILAGLGLLAAGFALVGGGGERTLA